MVIKRRSPNYPGIDLEDAIRVLADLYAGVGRGEFTRADAAQAWGYGSIGGPVRVRMAALRQYGLLEGKKGANPSLTTRALTLVLRNRASREYREALKQAAMAPSAFSELQGSMPSAAQDAIRQHLIVERNFTDEGASRFIEVYRATIALANLAEPDNIAGQDNGEWDLDEGEDDDMGAPTSTRQQVPSSAPAHVHEGTIAIPVPLGPSRIATITVPTDMSDADWKRLDRILEAYRPDDDARPGPDESREP